MTDIIITVFIILEELRDQLIKNTSFDILYNILDCILNDIIELDLRLTVFRNYITELSEFYKVLEKDI